ncbi:unnamed protein product [Lymnaea stagnalis]|uniref:Uncharacterized protein n=1 Tax=Lymnaea stagnalis TaxID=6523 RepID=A0AAV2H5Q4_LYMST
MSNSRSPKFTGKHTNFQPPTDSEHVSTSDSCQKIPLEESLGANNNKTYLYKALKIGGVAVGAVGAVALAPVMIGAAGFGATGITAGSLAAVMMSTVSTSGFGMGVVTALQSAGTAGLGLGAKTVIGLAGAAVGKAFAEKAAGKAAANAVKQDNKVVESGDRSGGLGKEDGKTKNDEGKQKEQINRLPLEKNVIKIKAKL